jgi:hypothetical protein
MPLVNSRAAASLSACREPEPTWEVIHPGDGRRLLKVVVPGEILTELLHQGLALAGQSARVGVITPNCREAAQNGADVEGYRLEA